MYQRIIHWFWFVFYVVNEPIAQIGCKVSTFMPFEKVMAVF